VDQLVDAATAAARDDAVAPYLGHVGPGPADTTFRYVFTRPPPRRGVVAGLRRHPGAIALAGLALAAIAGNAVAIWRRL
jgi:hypothetical protein